MKSVRKVQNYAVPDGNSHDSFEKLVELYYQVIGFITSSNKYLWVFDKGGKEQRGYQDIDVLAVKHGETHIVSVVANIDDKLANDEKVAKQREFFSRAEAYLSEVPEYSWLLENQVKHVLAYRSSYKTPNRMNQVREIAKKTGLDLLSGQQIIQHLMERVPELQKKGLHANNDLIGMIRIFLKYSLDENVENTDEI